MKRTWKKRAEDEGVSPVIATILMVAITVVLAAVLYVMVMGIRPPDPTQIPLGLTQKDRNLDSVSILVVSAPVGALVEGTSVSISQDGIPMPVNNVTVYTASGIIAAWCDSGDDWEHGTSFDSNDLKFEEGMTIVIYGDAISRGDEITFSNIGYFKTTPFNVS